MTDPKALICDYLSGHTTLQELSNTAHERLADDGAIGDQTLIALIQILSLHSDGNLTFDGLHFELSKLVR